MPIPAAIAAAIVNSVMNAVTQMPSAPPQANSQQTAVIALARSFPEESKAGELLPPIQRELQISGKTLFAAPGLQIRGPSNLIVMPNTVQTAQKIRYQLDPTGNVFRIWILSAAELAAANSQ